MDLIDTRLTTATSRCAGPHRRRRPGRARHRHRPRPPGRALARRSSAIRRRRSSRGRPASAPARWRSSALGASTTRSVAAAGASSRARRRSTGSTTRRRVEEPLGFPDRGRSAAVSPTTAAVSPQDHLEPVLVDHYRSSAGEVRFSTELVSFERDDARRDATLRDRSDRRDEPSAAATSSAPTGIAARCATPSASRWRDRPTSASTSASCSGPTCPRSSASRVYGLYMIGGRRPAHRPRARAAPTTGSSSPSRCHRAWTRPRWRRRSRRSAASS